MSELPKGWFNSELCDVAEVVSGNAFKSKDFVENGIPVVKISNVQSGEYIEKNQEYLPESFNNKDNSRFIVTYNDLLIALTRPIVSNKLKVCTYPNKSQVGLLNQRVARLDVNEGFSKRFLHYYLSSKEFRESVQASMSETLQPNLSPKSLSKINIACPPLAEQQRIVDKLDEVLAQVDTIKARLDGIPAILKRFRQSVLASAVSGKLTEEWRGQNDSIGFELSEFAEFWASEYSKAGKKYSAAKVTEDSQVSSILPNSWLNTCVGKIFDVHVGATPSRKDPMYWEGDIPWVSSGEVAFSLITETNEKITESGLLNSSTKIHPCGTVMLAMIGQGKTRGQPAILRIEAAHNQNTAALRVPEGMCVSEFLYYCLWEKYEETRRVGSGNNQKALNKSAVQNLHFPCPPYNEQKEIVRLVDQYFAFADTIEAQVKKAQARVDKLT
ncbi:restriction endonuclease subunit S [Vibrio owensii]|uniref:restriction endonuclease subunit S n=1 Tax=Vibrio owensii TaxID=696485 RepID=UPI003748EB04